MKHYKCANQHCRANLHMKDGAEPAPGTVIVCDEVCKQEYYTQQRDWSQLLAQWQPSHRPN